MPDLSLSPDPSGLRRRSPNPNSPIPYSPALLSPYIHAASPLPGHAPHALPHERHDPFQRYHHHPSPFLPRPLPQPPTIRLVPSESHAPRRSKSDDPREVRRAEAAGLRRHGTEPSPYDRHGYCAHHSGHAQRGDQLPALTLPLNIRRPSSSTSSSPAPSTPSSSLYHTSHCNPSRQSLHSGQDSSERPPLLARTTSALSSLKTLLNPFSTSSSSLKHRPSSPGAHSVHSSRSAWSFRSHSTCSSSATLPVPFYASTYLRSLSAISLGKDASSIPASGGGGGGTERMWPDKLTAKFPVRHREVDADMARERWTGYKWALLLSLTSVLGYGLAGLTWAMLILLRIQERADVIMVSDPDLVIFLTLACVLCIVCALLGLTGLLLNSRPILAFYCLLLWPTLLSMCLVGYTSYKRGSLQLDRKLNQAWSQFLDDEQRLRVQNALQCCGYFNPEHEATYSKKCYPRTILHGCKSAWTSFERASLHVFSTAAFSAIPIHLVNIVASLLCSNHVDKTFGRGLTPQHYRLQMSDVRANALAVLATLPKGGKGALQRHPAMSHRHRPRGSKGRQGLGKWDERGSEVTLSESVGDFKGDSKGG